MAAAKQNIQGETSPPGAGGEERRAIARIEGACFSVELQRQARHARTRSQSGGQYLSLRRLAGWLSPARLLRPVPLSFIMCVLTPSVMAALYYGIIASSTYESEARFAVRAGAISGIDALTSIAGLPSLNQVQDSLIVANFVESPAAVQALEKRAGLRQRYASEKIDAISRLAADAPAETLLGYWKRRIRVAIESPSGIITVKVQAYMPQDAFDLANGVVEESEALVNQLGATARADLVANSTRELADVERRLSEARERINSLRVAESVIDPQLTAQGTNVLINELRAQMVRLEQEIATVQRTVGANAPHLGLMRTRLETVQEQTRALENELTVQRDDGKDAIAGVMTKFDHLRLEQQILERRYASAAAALEQARASAQRQQMYLATFMRPAMPDDAAGPQRLIYPLLVFLGALLLWAIAWGGIRQIQKQR